jgi:hypothetical protein
MVVVVAAAANNSKEEWLMRIGRGNQSMGRNLSQCYSVHYKFHMT